MKINIRSLTPKRPLARILFSILIAAAFVYVIKLIFKNGGAFSDEGSYCAIAEGVLNGGLPYRDYFNEKAPLQYLWTALVMNSAGGDIDGARLASSLTLAATLSLIFWQILKRNQGLLISGVWMVVITLLGWMMHIYNNTAESSLALLFVATAALQGHQWKATSGVSEGVSQRNAFFMGFLQGIACGFRQTAAVSALILFVVPWMRGARRLYLYGGLTGLALWMGLLMYLGILDDFVQSAILFHVDNQRVGSYFLALQNGEVSAFLAWVAVIFVFYACTANNWNRIGMLVWGLTAALPFFGRMDGFRLWPSAALFFMLLFLYGDIRFLTSRTLWGGMATLASIGLFTQGLPGGISKYDQIQVYINRYVAQNESIWVGPFDPNIYCYAQRRPASKFYFVLPWVAKPEVHTVLGRDLALNKPKLIIDVSNPLFEMKTLVPEVSALIQAQYHRIGQVGSTKLYLRNAEPGDTLLPDSAAIQPPIKTN